MRGNFLLLILLSTLFISCVNLAETITPDWIPEMFFKNAQEAMDENRYQDALYYYEVFLIRYPENIQKRIVAEYERALIYYKTRKIKQAEAEFRLIINKYESSPFAMLYPPRFKLLSQIGLQNIEKRRAVYGRLFWRSREKIWADEHDIQLIDTEVNIQ